MAASLEIVDAAGEIVDLSATNPVAFGVVNGGTTGGPVEVQVRNAGDEDVYFVTVRAVQHPAAQVGSEADTFAATQIAASENGAFFDELDLGTLAPGDVVPVWVRWVVPETAPAGDVVWAVEAAGAST